MVKIKLVIMLLLGALFFQRCNTDEDEQDPTFTFSTENFMSNDTIFLDHTETFTFQLELLDDTELQSLRIFTTQISDADVFSCRTPLVPFIDLEITDLTGKEASFPYQIDFPDSLSGRLTTTVQVLDAAGNNYQELYTLELSNSARPFIDSLVFSATDSLCTLINLTSLTDLTCSVYAQNEEGINLLRFYWYLDQELISDQEFSLPAAASIAESVSTEVPALLLTDELTLKIQVTSISGVSNWASFQVEAN